MFAVDTQTSLRFSLQAWPHYVITQFTSQTDLYHSVQRAQQRADRTQEAELSPADSKDPFLARLVAGLLSNKDDIIHRQRRLAVGNLDSAAYSAGPHLSCAKFKACLKRAGLGLQ